jgi:hypothetical protein
MRCQIILEGDGGELDCREVETEEEIRDAMLLIVADCGYLAGGDVIRSGHALDVVPHRLPTRRGLTALVPDEARPSEP